MTETTLTATRVGDSYAAQLAEFSDEWAEIHRQQATLDARKARLLARSAAYADAFADATVPAIFPPAERRELSRRSTCAALAMATRTPERTVQRATNDAERLVDEAPAVLASLEAGRISARHAQVITDQLCDVPTAGRAAFLEQVLPVAESATASYLRQRARVLRERLHPESITARARRSEADRRVEFEPAADGMARVHLLTTAPIDPETAARIAVNAPSFTRILVQPETGAILSVGRNQYRVPADLQRAVRLRDGACRAPGCGRRARACDLDHSVAWENGGTTDVGNLACLCRHHHRMKHLPGWNLDHGPGGVLNWTTPDGKHHRTEPDPAPF